MAAISFKELASDEEVRAWLGKHPKVVAVTDFRDKVIYFEDKESRAIFFDYITGRA